MYGSKGGSRNRGRASKQASRSVSKQASRSRTSKQESRGGPEFAESTYISADEARRLSRGTTKQQHPMECICTICECGAHKCPPDRVQGRYYDLKTSYMQDFVGAYAAPSRPFRPQYIHKPRPFEGTTTNQDDFSFRGQPEKREMIRLKDNNIGNSGAPFEGVTTNQHDFRKWTSGARQPFRPDNRANVVPDDRDFRSEAAEHFTNKGPARRKICAPAHSTIGTIPFEGVTTNQADFLIWNSRPAQSVQRISQYRPRAEDRDFKTISRDAYTEKKTEHCPSIAVAVTSKPNNGHVMVEPCGDRWCHVDHAGTNWDATQQQQEAMQMPLF